MLFNGWQYVGSPAIGYLEKVARSYGLRSNLLLKVHYNLMGAKFLLKNNCTEYEAIITVHYTLQHVHII